MTSELRRRMSHDLQLAGLSPRTQDAYLRAFRMLAEHSRTPPDRLSEQQVREYFLHLKKDRYFAAARWLMTASTARLSLPVAPANPR